MSAELPPNPELLLQLVEMKMPFGKYKGIILCNLPVSYLRMVLTKKFFQKENREADIYAIKEPKK